MSLPPLFANKRAVDEREPDVSIPLACPGTTTASVGVAITVVPGKGENGEVLDSLVAFRGSRLEYETTRRSVFASAISETSLQGEVYNKRLSKAEKYSGRISSTPFSFQLEKSLTVPSACYLRSRASSTSSRSTPSQKRARPLSVASIPYTISEVEENPLVRPHSRDHHFASYPTRRNQSRGEGMAFNEDLAVSEKPWHAETSIADAKMDGAEQISYPISEHDDASDTASSPTASESRRSSRDSTWFGQHTYLITPPFTRRGLSAPGVVLPLTVKEYWRLQASRRLEQPGAGERLTKRDSISSIRDSDFFVSQPPALSRNYSHFSSTSSADSLAPIRPAYIPPQSLKAYETVSIARDLHHATAAARNSSMSRRSFNDFDEKRSSSNTVSSDAYIVRSSDYPSSLSTSRILIHSVVGSCPSVLIKDDSAGAGAPTVVVPELEKKGGSPQTPVIKRSKSKSFLGRLKIKISRSPMPIVDATVNK